MKRISFLLISALALVALAACTGATKEAQPAAESGTAEKVKTVSDQPAESGAQAGTTGNTISLSACLDNCNIIKQDAGLLSKETCRTGCFMTEAQEKRDPGICTDNVSDDLMLPTCLTGVAEEMGDVKVCDRIGTDKTDLMRGACYATVAEKINDTSVCEGIKDTMMYMSCAGVDSNQ